jgi:hypothetical protein
MTRSNISSKPLETWTYGFIQCDVCQFIWLAVFNIYCQKLECPHCEEMRQYEKIEQHH